MGRKYIYEMDGMSGDIEFWAKMLGVKISTLRARRYKKLPLELVLSEGKLKYVRPSKKDVCGVEGCENPEHYLGGGICRWHKYRLEKYGDVNGAKRVITEEKAYAVWQNMLASGVENAWETYEDFERDMGQPGTKYRCICRKDWDRGYSKENCFWGTKAQSRHVRMIKIGNEKKTITEWSKQTGIGVETLGYRLKQKWPEHKMLKGRKDSISN